MTSQIILNEDSVDFLSRRPFRTPVNCVITDPPFGVDNLSNASKTAIGRRFARKIANDKDPVTAISVFDQVMDLLLPQTSEDCDLYVFTSEAVLPEWMDCVGKLVRHGFVYKCMIIWDKMAPGQGDLSTWGRGFEVILFAKKGSRKLSDVRHRAVLPVPRVPAVTLIHPHQKPIKLLEYLIRHSTDPGDLIVDPFCGSGSTIHAARTLGRSALGLEKDKENFEKARYALDNIPESLI